MNLDGRDAQTASTRHTAGDTLACAGHDRGGSHLSFSLSLSLSLSRERERERESPAYGERRRPEDPKYPKILRKIHGTIRRAIRAGSDRKLSLLTELQLKEALEDYVKKQEPQAFHEMVDKESLKTAPRATEIRGGETKRKREKKGKKNECFDPPKKKGDTKFYSGSRTHSGS